jgi:hypothetical protein
MIYRSYATMKNKKKGLSPCNSLGVIYYFSYPGGGREYEGAITNRCGLFEVGFRQWTRTTTDIPSFRHQHTWEFGSGQFTLKLLFISTFPRLQRGRMACLKFVAATLRDDRVRDLLP